MPVSFDKFVKLLTASGLMSAETLRLLLAELPAGQRPQDGEALAKWLVKREYLTPYQAKEIYRGRTKGLVHGNYVILDRIGAGGMGQVFKAEHRRMKRTVALKVLPEDFAKDPSLVARFQREVQAAAKLMHPNIVTAFDADEADGTFFLVMECVPGKDLATIVRTHGPLPVNQAIYCLLDAARGLEYAHSRGVIHRDIKPANLLWSADAAGGADAGESSGDRNSGVPRSPGDFPRPLGTVKILDMGLARIEDASKDVATQAELTGTGMVMGTIDYMAPEQALNTKSADHRSDVYSLGITLYFLLTGKPAYPGDSVMERLIGHREAPIPSLRTDRANVPAALDELFARMVAKQPADRCQSMSEVVEALEGIQSGNASQLPGDETAFAPTDTGDTALQSFLRAMESGTATQPEVSDGPTHVATDDEATIAETVVSQANEETATVIKQSVTELLTRSRHRQPKWLWPSIIGGGLLALTAILIPMMRGRDVSAPTSESPSTSVATEASASPAEPDGSADAERSAARQLLRNGFVLTVRDFGGTTHQVNDAVQLPSDPFVIVEAESHHRRGPLQAFDVLTPEDLHPLADRPQLRKLTLHFDELTADHLAVLARIPSLSFIALTTSHPSAVTDVDMARFVADQADFGTLQTTNLRLTGDYLRALPNPAALEILTLSESDGGEDPGRIPNVSVEALSLLADAVNLESLGLVGASLVDEHLEPIARLKSLQNLNISATGLARDDVDHLRIALPECTIISDFGTFEPQSMDAQPNLALAFDGVDDYVEIPSLRLDNFPESQPLTMEVTLNVASPQVSNPLNWLGKNWISLFTRDGNFGAGRLTAGGSTLVEAPLGTPSDRPRRVAAVWDGKAWTLFLDGKRQEITGIGFELQPTEGGLFLGGAPLQKLTGHDTARWFNGTIDEVRISKSARYFANYAPLPRLAADADTLALYRVDEGSGTTLQDDSGNGHHGTIQGAQWVAAAVSRNEPAGPVTGLSFDGVDDEVTFAPPPLPHREVTVEGWVTVREASRDGANLPVCQFGDAGLAVGGRGSSRGFWVLDLVSAGSFEGVTYTKYSARFGVRTHVAVVLNEEYVRLFVGGEIAGQQPTAAIIENFKEFWTSLTQNRWSLGSRQLSLEGRRRFGPIDFDEFRVSHSSRYPEPFEPATELTLDSQTVVLYRFDRDSGDVLHDGSGNGHHGTIHGAKWVRGDGVAQTPRQAIVALSFDGIDDYVELPDLPLDSTQPLTIETIVDLPRSAGGPAVLCSSLGSTGMQLVADGVWSFRVAGRGGLLGLSAGTVKGGRQHVAAVRSGNTLRIFVDGIEQQPIAGGAVTSSGPADLPMLIGARLGDDGKRTDFLRGTLHAIRFSQTARYTSDFAPRADLPDDPDTLAVFRLNEDTGTLFKDSSRNGHDGTIHGAEWVSQTTPSTSADVR